MKGLLLFLSVPLLCGLWFGFGYAAGQRHKRAILRTTRKQVAGVLTALDRLTHVDYLGNPQEAALRQQEGALALQELKDATVY